MRTQKPISESLARRSALVFDYIQEFRKNPFDRWIDFIARHAGSLPLVYL